MAHESEGRDPLLKDAADWLIRVQEAPQDAALRAALDNWLAQSDAHSRAYRRAERMWRLYGDLSKEDVVRAAPAGMSAAGAASLQRPSTRRMGRFARLATAGMMAVAAVIAFLFLPGLQLWIAADVLTDTGELRHVTLDDGSAVHLDAASAIAVRYSASRRDVKLLAGQAYFDVAAAADRPFKVTAEDVAVTVTGTAFNVRLTSRSVSISVRSGAVEVTSKRYPFIASLSPGERLDVDRASGRIARERVAPDDVAAWKDWRLAVDGVTLAEIIEELNRHYKGMIVLQDRALAARRIAGVFDLRRPVDALHAAVSTQKGSVTAFTPYVLVVSGP